MFKASLGHVHQLGTCSILFIDSLLGVYAHIESVQLGESYSFIVILSDLTDLVDLSVLAAFESFSAVLVAKSADILAEFRNSVTDFTNSLVLTRQYNASLMNHYF